MEIFDATKVDREIVHPWPHLSTFFGPVLKVTSKEKNNKGTLVKKGKIRCKECCGIFSFSTDSLFNLKLHFKKKHVGKFHDLESAAAEGSKRGKARSSKNKPHTKRIRQANIVSSFAIVNKNTAEKMFEAPNVAASTSASAQFTTYNDCEEVSMISHSVVDKKIFEWIVSGQRHVSVVEESAFLDLMHYLAPNYKVPSAVAASEMINAQYFAEKSKLQQSLFMAANESKIALSVGLLTNGCRSMILRAYYVTAAWTIKSHVIGCIREKGISLKSEYIAKWINDKLDDFGLLLGSVICIVHDGDVTISNAVSMLTEAYGCHSLPSCDSVLRFVIGTLCNDAMLKTTLETIQDVVQFYTVGEVGKILTEKWDRANIGDKTEAAMQAAKDRSQISMSPCFEHTSTVYEKATRLLNILQPVDAALSFLKKDEFVHSSSIPILLTGLEKKINNDLNKSVNFVKTEASYVTSCQNSQMPSNLTSVLREKLVESLRNVGVFSASDITTMAAALDPRYKKLMFMNSDERQTVYSMISTECYFHHRDKEACADENNEPPMKKMIIEKVFSSTSLMDDILKLGAGYSEDEEQCESNDDVLQAKIKKEMDTYFDEKSPTSDICPARWWQANQSRFPILAKVARIYLCIPATARLSPNQITSSFIAPLYQS